MDYSVSVGAVYQEFTMSTDIVESCSLVTMQGSMSNPILFQVDMLSLVQIFICITYIFIHILLTKCLHGNNSVSLTERNQYMPPSYICSTIQAL